MQAVMSSGRAVFCFKVEQCRCFSGGSRGHLERSAHFNGLKAVPLCSTLVPQFFLINTTLVHMEQMEQ